MADDNALDDFLATATSDVSVGSSQETSEQLIVSRPKLKKIKRIKVRPTLDIPQAPEKVTSSDVVSEESFAPNNISVEDKVDNEKMVNNETTLEAFVNKEAVEATSLVTTATAQDLASTDSENSYILNDLPPELDYAMDDDVEDPYFDAGNYVKKSAVYMVAFVFLFVGLVIGKIFFSEQKIENRGLEGIVTNPDTPSGRPRCGLTDKNQACIFYILNWYKQELNGRDFYKLAAQLTGREEYMIESENMHYANVKIKPGHFAQLNIPALK